MLGVFSRAEALKLATNVGLDLVEISPTADPPVCKILDYGRFKYEQQKKKAEAKKKQKTIEIKEIQIRPMIDSNDFGVKCRAAQSFLIAGHKIKVSMRFRGREITHQEIGLNVLKKMQIELEEFSKVEYEPKLEGKQMIMVLSPKTGDKKGE
jgi:translation initiation factor IF-3